MIMVKLPANAKKVFEGVIHDVYQWEQKLYDGSYATFEKVIRTPSVQILVITDDRKIILFDEDQPPDKKFISMPGGRIDKDEDPDIAAKRELLEELGFVSDDFFKWKVSTLCEGSFELEIFYYIAKKCKKINEPKLDPGERITKFEVSFEEFLEVINKDNFRNKDLKNVVSNELRSEKRRKEFGMLLFE